MTCFRKFHVGVDGQKSVADDLMHFQANVSVERDVGRQDQRPTEAGSVSAEDEQVIVVSAGRCERVDGAFSCFISDGTPGVVVDDGLCF